MAAAGDLLAAGGLIRLIFVVGLAVMLDPRVYCFPRTSPLLIDLPATSATFSTIRHIFLQGVCCEWWNARLMLCRSLFRAGTLKIPHLAG